MKSNGSQTPIRISLGQDVAIAVGVTYTVSALIRGSDTLNGEHGLSTVCTTFTVTFSNNSGSANGTDVTRGQIPQLFFVT